MAFEVQVQGRIFPNVIKKMYTVIIKLLQIFSVFQPVFSVFLHEPVVPALTVTSPEEVC